MTDLEALHPFLRIGAIESQLQGKFSSADDFFCTPACETGKTRLKFLGFYPEDGNLPLRFTSAAEQQKEPWGKPMTIRSLFDPTKDIYRTIEKVITYGASTDVHLKAEISEYVVHREH